MPDVCNRYAYSVSVSGGVSSVGTVKIHCVSPAARFAVVVQTPSLAVAAGGVVCQSLGVEMLMPVCVPGVEGALLAPW